AQYEAELARAAADRSWEEPLDTAARLLEEILVDPHAHAQESGERGTSYGYELLVIDGEPVEEQVRRCAERILADDPRNTVEIREA
ncbi:hypothetical protein ACFVDH_27325, partial [Streptomyces sp. NPDC057674]